MPRLDEVSRAPDTNDFVPGDAGEILQHLRDDDRDRPFWGDEHPAFIQRGKHFSLSYDPCVPVRNIKLKLANAPVTFGDIGHELGDLLSQNRNSVSLLLQVGTPDRCLRV